MDSDKKPTTQSIIASFGGVTKMAEMLGCGVTTVSNWHRTGFPRSREVDLIDLAERVGVSGVTAAALRTATTTAVEADAMVEGPRKPGRPARERATAAEAA